MGCPIFFECKEKSGVLGLITGDKEKLLQCLGSQFEELDATKAEGAGEKHLPQVEVKDNLVVVTVGSVAHPMTEEHSINWIYLQTQEGSQLKKLSPGKEPKAEFALSKTDSPVAAFAYCNLHGFWKTSIS